MCCDLFVRKSSLPVSVKKLMMIIMDRHAHHHDRDNVVMNGFCFLVYKIIVACMFETCHVRKLHRADYTILERLLHLQTNYTYILVVVVNSYNDEDEYLREEIYILNFTCIFVCTIYFIQMQCAYCTIIND